MLKIERCIDATQAEWIARNPGPDLHVLLSDEPPEEAVLLRSQKEPAGSDWTAAIGVELADRDNPETFAEVVPACADPGPKGALH